MIHSILLVDDDSGAIQLLGRILAGVAELRFATTGEDALRLAREAPPDLLLLDAELPGMSGFEVCEAFKADPALAHVPVIFITSHAEPTFEVSGFELGAADFIAKPVSPSLVLARVKTQLRIKRLADELRHISTTDALTGVANRRRFDESLDTEWRRARRSGSPLALLLIDVDHFKRFNDRYGHPAGDVALRSVAQALAAASLRPADLVARYGGEEFAVLLPQTPRHGAEHVAGAILGGLAALGIEHDDSPTGRLLGASIGIGCYDERSACWWSATTDSNGDDELRTRCSAAELVQAADRALYAAKNAGRSQARLLDIADFDAPQLGRSVAPGDAESSRPGRSAPQEEVSDAAPATF